MSGTGGTAHLGNGTVSDSFFDRYGDPRVRDWFMMESPLPVVSLVAFYLVFCTKIGPRMMQNRKPYELKNAMILYNFVNVVICIYAIYEGLMAGWWNDYSFTCQHIDYSNNPKAVRMARASWLYFLVKIFDLLDTVFFVFRKKYNQISFLHIYHHAIMPLTTWGTAKFVPGGHITLNAIVNSSVHVVMYSYYFIAALGPEYKKYLWWKKYLTIIQLVQFGVVIIHNGQVFFNGCDIPKFVPFYLCVLGGLFTYLFGDFYIKTYITKTAKKAS